MYKLHNKCVKTNWFKTRENILQKQTTGLKGSKKMCILLDKIVFHVFRGLLPQSSV